MRPLPGLRHLVAALATALAVALTTAGARPALAAIEPPAAAALAVTTAGARPALAIEPAADAALVVAVTTAGARPALAATGPPAAAVAYAPPVDAPVSDPFRPPPGPYAAGNRGIDFTTTPGTAVRAAAGGEVTFAGPVGGTRHVVVLHPDGLRTSYSFLATTAVIRGQVVDAGEVVGTAGASLHFGARAGERYVDPGLLLAGAPVEVHLVALEDRHARASGVERRWLVEALVAAAGASGDAARWLASGSAAVGADALALAGDALVAGVAAPVLAARATAAAGRTAAELLEDQRGCTPDDLPLPVPAGERRIVVLVAGYGSSGGTADVLDVDTGALGYADEDRVQFSYAGGRVPGVGALDGVPVAGYGPSDAMGDLREAGARLRRLLDDIAEAHPGVPVDVIAHSQGGLVARQALAVRDGTRPAGTGHPPVEHLVTLGTPHHGAAAAAVAGELGLRAPSSALGAGLAVVTGGGVDPRAPAVAQLATGSPFLRELERAHLPAGLDVTSIAAVGDVVVPAVSSTLAGADNALVPLAGPTAHGRLPGSQEAAEALALALGDQAPACAATVALVAGAALAAGVEAVEHGLGSAVAPSVVAADRVASALVARAG